MQGVLSTNSQMYFARVMSPNVFSSKYMLSEAEVSGDMPNNVSLKDRSLIIVRISHNCSYFWLHISSWCLAPTGVVSHYAEITLGSFHAFYFIPIRTFQQYLKFLLFSENLKQCVNIFPPGCLYIESGVRKDFFT